MIKKTFIFLLFVFCFASCRQDHQLGASAKYHTFQGETMGTYYRITIDNNQNEFPLLPQEIENTLLELNDGLSTYIESSAISMLNTEADYVLDLNTKRDQYFYDVFKRAKEIFKSSDGDFDPTVMPLVNFYGFGYKEKKRLKQLDSMVVRDILKDVSFDHVNEFEVNGKTIISKARNATEIDFSAIAKGYAVDVLANHLKEKDIKNYLVDIGGEMVVAGKNSKGKNWKLAISRPVEDAKLNETDVILSLTDVAMASSGNYRNFYEVDGTKYSHTINPKSGFPERSNLLGVSIITGNCMDADAYATACMVKGLDKSKIFIEALDGVEACFIYNDEGELATQFSSGFSKYLTI